VTSNAISRLLAQLNLKRAVDQPQRAQRTQGRKLGKALGVTREVKQVLVEKQGHLPELKAKNLLRSA
jgi:hypothetical protein